MALSDKAKAISVIHNCAVLYKNNLSGKNVLFVTLDNGKSSCFETLYMPHNFLHLTGVKTDLSSEFFFKAALNKRLSPNSIEFDSGGATELKLGILPRLMAIHVTARMIGDYDNSKPLLVTDKFAGTVAMVMGFTCINGIYVPNTALKMDIRDITIKATRRRVVAILVKSRGDDLYKQVSYLAKGVNIKNPVIALLLRGKADIDNL